ncbi:hypothetical protein ACFO5O_00695 [Geojedonia litorea]|uniref:DUF2490 domain-containing protein n=1 Tax=Geojedonia litorea TaxID=1268269 RepID=A0ABV9MZ30_9FLAO
MKALGIILFYNVILLPYIWSQELSYHPEILSGHRSFSYQHKIEFSVNPSLKLNNITLFDTEYNNDDNNLYFIRNSISYEFFKNIKVVGAFGIKNPGSFVTSALQYNYKKKNYMFMYSVGTTYQNGFTIEQNFGFEFKPKINMDMYGLLKLQVISNTSKKEYVRGIQQLRIGVIKNNLQFGFAANLDQFNNASKTLANYGIFYKHNLIYSNNKTNENKL